MPQAVAVGAVQVRMVVQRVHLVDAYVGEVVGVRVDRVDERARLAVRERHDQVGRAPDVVEHRFGWRRLLVHEAAGAGSTRSPSRTIQ